MWTRAGNICANAGNVSCVGNFNENGLNVNNWNGNANNNVGLGASRNSHLVSKPRNALFPESVSLGEDVLMLLD